MQSKPITNSFLTNLLFSWARPLLSRGISSPHNLDSILKVPAEDQASVTSEELKKFLIKRRNSSRPLVRALIDAHGAEWCWGMVLMIIHVIFQTFSAMLLRPLINSINSNSADDRILLLIGGASFENSIILAVILFTSSVIMCLSVHHAFYHYLRVASRLKSSLSQLIYDKALRLSREAKDQTTSGEIVNLMANDVNRLHWLLTLIFSPLAHTTQIILVLILLFQMFGPASLVGAGSMVLIIVISSFLARVNVRFRKALLKVSDKRVGLINEILTHIRAIKLYGWEKSFTSQVMNLRKVEVGCLKKIAMISVGLNSVFQSAPVLVSAATFITLALLGELPSVGQIFSGIALFSILRWSMTVLPEAIVGIMEGGVSARRIEEFFALSEYQPRPVDPDLEVGSISVSDLSAEWSPGRPALKEINLKIKPGEFVCIVGRVGSGKSALLQTLLGEVRCSKGSLRSNGSMAYVSQHAWIVSDTIRQNVVLGGDGSEELYQRVISASGLSSDLKTLPKGDLTEIGERGVNLSGGQKQRVSLARAAYAERDIYLLDDPLSALDPKLADQVFKQLINGELRRKTRVLVSHRLEFAERAERIVVLDNGRIVEHGTPLELLSRDSAYSRLKQRYFSEVERASEVRTDTLPDAVQYLPLVESSEVHTEEGMIGAPSQEGIIVEEERQSGSVDKAMYQRYLRAFAPGLIALAIILSFLLKDGLQLGTDSWLARWSLGSISAVNTFFEGYIILALLLVLATFTRTFLIRVRGLNAGTTLHQELLKGVLRAPMQFFESNPVGRILSRFSADIEVVDLAIPGNIQEMMGCVSGIFIALTLILGVSPLTLLGIIPIVFLYYRFQRLFRATSRETARLGSWTNSPIFAQYSESIAGVTVIRAFDWQERFLKRLLVSIDKNQSTFFSSIAANRWLGVRLEILGSFLVGLVTLCAVCIPSYFGVAGAGLSVMYALSVTGTLNWLVRTVTMLESSMNSVERINYYTTIESERWEGEVSPPNWPSAGEIRFNDLQVRYRPDAPLILRGFSAVIRAGERVGIIGGSGAGKSTLILALTRIIEVADGDIQIDGVSIKGLELESLRSAIAVIPQDPVMFLGTVRQNLDPFNSLSDAEIWSALEKTHSIGFIRALDKGLDSEVREGGSNFSAGQRQLICLARALLRGNKIIVLDEATASVDVETDMLVQRTIRESFLGRTIITIAHRVNTIMDYDRVMMIDKGRVVKFDKPRKIVEADFSPNH